MLQTGFILTRNVLICLINRDYTFNMMRDFLRVIGVIISRIVMLQLCTCVLAAKEYKRIYQCCGFFVNGVCQSTATVAHNRLSGS